jgi:hypothetical protein
MMNPGSVSRQWLQRYTIVFFIFLLCSCFGNLACKRHAAPTDGDSDTSSRDTASNVTDIENTKDTGPCALTQAEVSAVINESITETSSHGNWGVASTCTYATSTAPAALEISSAKSTDVSIDRAIKGAQDVPNLGDEAVWIPVTSVLTVTDKNKGKLLRIGVKLPVSKDKRLEMAIAIAKLALPKL